MILYLEKQLDEAYDVYRKNQIKHDAPFISKENFSSGTYTFQLTQNSPIQADNVESKPLVIPIKVSLFLCLDK